MKKTIYLVAFCCFGIASLLAAQDSDADFTVIINSANETAELERARLSKIFLKKTKRWPNSSLRVMPVDQDERAPIREAFTQAIHGKKVSAIKSFWQRMIFSGRDVPPPEVSSDQAVIEFVQSDPGAVGYVSAGTELGEGVKVLEVIE